MKTILRWCLVLAALSLAGHASAETTTFIKDYTYQASELDSKVSCRTIAMEMVKRLLLEELGTFMVSSTEMVNMKLTREEVKTYSAGVVHVEVAEEKWDGTSYYLKAKVSADSAEIAASLQKIKSEFRTMEQLAEVSKKADEYLTEIARLKQMLAASEAKNKELSRQLGADYKATAQGLGAMDWLSRGFASHIAGRFKEAVDEYTKALALNSELSDAYFNRGNAYFDLGQTAEAISDYARAIELKPGDVDAYFNRANAYYILGERQQAVIDYDKAIALKPGDADLYNNRGVAYAAMGKRQEAMKDFDKAVQLRPGFAHAIYNQACVHAVSGKKAEALAALSKAISLEPSFKKQAAGDEDFKTLREDADFRKLVE